MDYCDVYNRYQRNFDTFSQYMEKASNQCGKKTPQKIASHSTEIKSLYINR